MYIVASADGANSVAKMVRKQIYIQDRQERLLRRIAETRGVSQAQVVREAIEGQAIGQGGASGTNPAAWARALDRMRSLHERAPSDQKPHRWSREDLYEDRLSRHDRDPD